MTQGAIGQGLGMIWTNWWILLHWLSPFVAFEDTLPVTVAIIASIILFYIAFRYYMLKRLMKDSDDTMLRRFSLILAISFAALGTYLGWIPFLGVFMGLWVGIIAIVFIVILMMAVMGMAKTASAQYTKISGEAAKLGGDGMALEVEGKKAQHDAQKELNVLKQNRRTEKAFESAVTDLELSENDVLQRFRNLNTIIGRARIETNDPIRSKTNAIELESVFNKMNKMTSSWHLMYEDLSKKRKFFKRIGKKYFTRKSKTIKELEKTIKLLNKISEDVGKQKDEDLSPEIKREINNLTGESKQYIANLRKYEKIIKKDIATMRKWKTYEDNGYAKFKEIHKESIKEFNQKRGNIRKSIEAYKRAAEDENQTEMLNALSKAKASTTQVVGILEKVIQNDTHVIGLENQFEKQREQVLLRQRKADMYLNKISELIGPQLERLEAQEKAAVNKKKKKKGDKGYVSLSGVDAAKKKKIK